MLTGVFKSYFNPRGTCIPTLTFILIYTNYILPFFISNKILFFISNSTILIYSSKITLLTSFFILIHIIYYTPIFTLFKIYNKTIYFPLLYIFYFNTNIIKIIFTIILSINLYKNNTI